jgi:hypothetical protein
MILHILFALVLMYPIVLERFKMQPNLLNEILIVPYDCRAAGAGAAGAWMGARVGFMLKKLYIISSRYE